MKYVLDILPCALTQHPRNKEEGNHNQPGRLLRGEGASPVNIPDPRVSMTFRDDMALLYYREPVCSRGLSRHGSRNGVYARDLPGHHEKVQRYICNDCPYSFESRPPGYGYGKHIPDYLRRKAVSAFSISSKITITTDEYHYRNALVLVSSSLGIDVKGTSASLPHIEAR